MSFDGELAALSKIFINKGYFYIYYINELISKSIN